MNDWVVIGRLMRARGNRGELIGQFDSTDPDREAALKKVALDLNGRRQIFDIEEVWRHDGRPVFKFVGVDSISDAEVWERAEILVPPDEVEKPEDGAYSYQDLVGCRVVSGNSDLGAVDSVEDYGGPSLLKVKTSEGKEVLIPFAREICKEIDVAAKRIRVELPEGLLDFP